VLKRQHCAFKARLAAAPACQPPKPEPRRSNPDCVAIDHALRRRRLASASAAQITAAFIAAILSRANQTPCWCAGGPEWTDGRISFIRDYRYVRFVVVDAELVLAPDAAPPAEATAHG